MVAVAVTVEPAAVDTQVASMDGLALTAMTLACIAAAAAGVTNTFTSRVTESPEAKRRRVFTVTVSIDVWTSSMRAMAAATSVCLS